ncbi:MAG: hypothetical protein SGILL_005980, partial [Bacillariaceae sp.]
STKPYLGTGISSVDRLVGPRTLSVDRYTIDRNLWWSITNLPADGTANQTKTNTSLTRSHDTILGSLTTCVQQCLVREPLLAVALSFAHDLNLLEFKNSISQGVSTAVAQHTVGCTSGEINEHICFAALQLASLQPTFTDNYTAGEVKEFLESLFGYLDVEPDEASLSERKIVKVLPDWNSGKGKSEPVVKTLVDLLDEIDENEWKGATVPLLIPAHSKEGLEEIVNECPALFDDLPIAGLVPGITNARLDANAYEWKKADEKKGFCPCWCFEFKIFSNRYTREKAEIDLKAKCDQLQSHALLIAFRPEGKSELSVTHDGNYLRIVALVQTTP